MDYKDEESYNLKKLSLEKILQIKSELYASGLVYHTPVLTGVQYILKENSNAPRLLSLKLENMQNQGSFKVRGTVSQFFHIKKTRDKKIPLVTMSAGNYGKAFCYTAKQFGYQATVFMPINAPSNRKQIMEEFGAEVYQCKTEELMKRVEEFKAKTKSIYMHPFDDPLLISGHASAGLEAVEDLPEAPDIVVVCCGGGGFLAGVTLAFHLKKLNNTKIYGVEPESAPSMYCSFKSGHPVTITPTPTIAAGLAPPFAGENSYNFIHDMVEGIILVSEAELRMAVSTLYHAGLVVEPSGAAAFAAVMTKKVPNMEGKHVLVFITGGNSSAAELANFISE